jgi:RNA polymerase sigma-70 factor, ECF subfamily
MEMSRETAVITGEATMSNESGNGHAGAGLDDRSGEQALVAAAQAGMTDALEKLLVRHKAALYRAARRFTENHEDAEDLVQDAMLQAFVHVHRFRRECHFGTWLITIVNNAALSMKRRRKNRYFLSIDSGHEHITGQNRWEISDRRVNPERDLIQQELYTALHRVLVRQSPTHQTILERCVLDGVRVADVASSLGLTTSSAKSSLHRARRKLTESFERRGLITRRERQNNPVR